MTIIISQRSRTGHHDVIMIASTILLLLPLDLISGLMMIRHQNPSTFTTAFARRRPISLQHQQPPSLILLWSSAASSNAADDIADETHPAYDWDEQFEELQSFAEKYGHCNFPQNNPTKEMQRTYPMLKRFCHDQRVEYKPLQHRKKNGYKMMSLAVFDREVRFRRLAEMGFEFNPRSAQWFDHYHELIEYSNENNGNINDVALDSKNYPELSKWVYFQRRRRNGYQHCTKLSELEIKLLDNVGFEWNNQRHDESWTASYQKLVAVYNKHGDYLMMDINDSLYKWIEHQRRRRAGAKGNAGLTDEQIRLLDEIEFPWKPQRHDAKWYDMYNKLQEYQRKHGHCQPGRSTHAKLYKWSKYQRVNHQDGRLSTEQIKLLDKLEFSWEPRIRKWPKMYGELTEYFNTHGHLQVNQDDAPDLYEWMTTQRQRYHGPVGPKGITDLQIEKLEELQFCWSLDWRERTWREKYTEAVEFFKQHDHILVTKKENPSLYNWIQMQGKRYEKIKGQKPLSEEELELLEQLDFPFLEGEPRMAWNAMYTELERYLKENDGRFPTSHKDDPDLNRWVRQQRHRYRQAYGYVPLLDEQKSLLESINFPMYPEGKQTRAWYTKYDELVEFWKEHGHFLIDESKDPTLHKWVAKQRVRYGGKAIHAIPLSKSQIYLLERIGFTWTSNRDEIEWQRIYDEVVEFLEVRGRFPGMRDNPSLARWLSAQRIRCKPDKTHTYKQLSEYQIQQLEKIGVLQ